MQNEIKNLAQAGKKLAGQWDTAVNILRFCPGASILSGSMEWLDFAPVFVKQMDYFISSHDDAVYLKLQDDHGEQNFQIIFEKDRLVLNTLSGHRLSLKRTAGY